MRPLKIGIVTQSYYPHFGGVTEHVHHMALALEERGHSVTVITGGPKAPVQYPSPRVIRAGRTILVPSNGARATMTLGLGLKGWLKDVMRSEKFDLINCQCPLRPTLPLLAIKEAPCPVIGTFHASAKSNFWYALLRKALKPYHSRLAGSIAVSEPARDFVRSYFGGKYRIIPNGVDTERFSPDVRPLEKFDDGVFNVLYVGRLEPRKGLSVLIDAYRDFSAVENQKTRLIIVGDGPLRGRLRRSICGKIQSSIHFEGTVHPDLLPRYYASAQVLCSPATGGESFGIVLLEAMASGIPVVASDIPGYRTAVKNGEHGLLIETGSRRSLATALGLLAGDESLRKQMSAAGRANSELYSWNVVAGKMEDYFSELLNGSSQYCSKTTLERPASISTSIR
jgi:phosphatidylinositol alpha-mannosyltransferase